MFLSTAVEAGGLAGGFWPVDPVVAWLDNMLGIMA
jgi:hypothetical protein